MSSVVVTDGSETLDAPELRRRVEALAGFLAARGIGPGDRVGVALDRGVDLVVALHAVHRAGAAFVPLDPGYPPARLRMLVDDARPALLLSASRVHLADRLGGGGHACPIVQVDRQAAEIAACPGLLPPEAPADALAYVIFTSGSTGRPKGVMVERGHLDRFFAAMDELLGAGASEPRTWAATTSVSFDISILELLYAVQRGYRLVVVPQDQQAPPALARVFARHGVTHFQCTPSLAGALIGDGAMRAALGALRCHLVGGETLPAPLARELRTLGCRVINMYGPTETTIWSTCHALGDEDPVPIGRPLANTTAHVVDEALRPVPPGRPGELLLGGGSVARGYLGDPDLTRERFCEGPGGERVYRTGDMVVQRPDGALLFLGRRDQQVKIRGHRIELGEVEAALVEHPAVGEAAAVARGEEALRLLAYVAPRPGASCDPEDVRAFLRGRLPEHAVPSAVIALARLPRTPNGKIDRNALPAPPSADTDAPAGGGQRSEIEARLAQLLGAALRTEPPGRDQQLLQIGVDSLMAMRLLTALHEELGVELSVREVFEAGTLGQLAERLARARAAAAGASAWPTVAARPEARHDRFPLNEVQQAYWMGRSREYELGGLSMHSFVELELPALDVSRLERALAAVIARHDMLRAIVGEDGTQRVLPQVPVARIPVTDFTGRPAADAEAWLAAERERLAHQVLPLTTWPLFELAAVHLPDGGWRMLVSLDGIMNDAGSVHIAVSELVRLHADPEAALPPLDLSFRDYVHAELEHHDSEAYRRSWDYWREHLSALPPAPELPVTIPAGVPRFARRTGSLPAATWRELRARASSSGLMPSGCLLALYAEVLATFARKSRFLVNVTLFNRLPVHRAIEGVVGDFTSLILLDVDGSRDRSFAERARAAQTQLWRDLDHRRVSGVRVLRELGRSHPGRALAPVVFTSTLGGGAYAMAGHGALPEERGGLTQTPQVLLDNMVGESVAGDLVWTWDAVEAAFPPGMLDEMAASFRGLLERLAGDAQAWSEVGRPPVAVPVAPAPVAAVEPPAGRLEDGMLAQLAADRGRQTAVVAGLRRIGFAELHGRARQVENLLVGHGVRPGEHVAIVMQKGWEQVVAALAVLRAGAAYVPIDPEWPADRIARLLGRCEIRVVLTRSQERIDLPGGAVRVNVDGVPPMRDAGSLRGASRDPDALAYVIFTSGSTGEPKGVMIPHRGALNTIEDINVRFEVGPEDRILGLSALSFDLSVYDLFGTLAAGARLILPAPEQLREPAAWLELIRREGATVWNSVPALMEMLVNYLDELGAPSVDDVPLRRS